jgi:hypothetical protein
MLKNKLLSAMGGVEAIYIEDVFSTYLYSGSSPSSQDILNGVDLDGEGGLIWIKDRSRTANHKLVDTVRSSGQTLATNLDTFDTGEVTSPTWLSNGFSLPGYVLANETGVTYASWTFRKQPKFFDVVTYTGTGANRTIAHSLGSVPGCVVVKRTDTTADWQVYHRANTANPETDYLVLNSTAATADSDTRWNDTQPTDAVFNLGTDATVNASGGAYVAYLFAHNAGGFGLTGNDNVISCGSFTSNSDGSASVNLGYEPQFLLYKRTDSTEDWILLDTMRGFSQTSGALLRPNTSGAEQVVSGDLWNPTATGFIGEPGTFGVSTQNIYIAIRRGPMKVPTTGTSVFAPATHTGTGTATTITSAGFPVDLVIGNSRNAASYGSTGAFGDRLRGKQNLLYSPSTGAEDTTNVSITGFDVQNGISVGNTDAFSFNFATGSYVNWFLQRAPGFFDEVCYTGNGSTQTITHNLGVAPELIIAKNRGQAGNNWPVLFNFASTTMNYGFLNLTNSCPNDTYANVGVFSAAPTSTSMFLINSSSMNASGFGIVAYLFATCPGVSKVFSYTGNGSSQTINCGFTGGARFVLIKRTDSTGDWYVWDTARGIVAGNDPHLSLNTTAAEVTSNDTIDTDSTGFVVNQVAATNVNVNAATYIGLAIS